VAASAAALAAGGAAAARSFHDEPLPPVARGVAAVHRSRVAAPQRRDVHAAPTPTPRVRRVKRVTRRRPPAPVRTVRVVRAAPAVEFGVDRRAVAPVRHVVRVSTPEFSFEG